MLPSSLLRPFAALALLAGVVAPLAAQQPPSGFNLAATRDFAVTGMRTAPSFRFWVTNAGPMDAQQGIESLQPAQIRKVNTFFAHLSEVALWATAGRTDYQGNRQRVPSLANVRNAGTGGHTVSINNHLNPAATDWLPADGSLGVRFSGKRTPSSDQLPTAPACLVHAKDLVPPGFTLMAGSDCEPTWGVDGWGGRGNVPFSVYLDRFKQQGNTFAFDFWTVPSEATQEFIGNNFQTYGFISDFNVSNNLAYGNVIAGQSGAPSTDGYPLALEWQFDAFNFKDTKLEGMVFWQATVTNRSRDRYGAAIDYDSLYAGFLLRPTTAMSRAGFWPEMGAVVFNDLRSRSDCDGARALPERLVITNFIGTCASIDVSRGFARGAMALVVLKSPIGDLRNKLFSNATSPFLRPTHPLAGDTITYNIGRSCGQECSSTRLLAGRGQSAWGTLSSHEADALAGDQPSSLPPNDYWFLFHPANGAAYGDGPRVNLASPRAGGGFNWCVPGPTGPGGKVWTYRSNRPSAAPVGPDTLFLDDCNSASNQLVGMWKDTFPDRSLKLIRGSEYVGAGPFRLAAGQTASFVIALVLAADSASIERSVRDAVQVYHDFYSVPQAPPAPRVVAVGVDGGSIQNTLVRISLDATRMRWVDEFLLFQAQRYRTAGPTTPEARIRRMNPWLPDSLEKRAPDNIARILVYKSCNPTATTLTFTTTRTLGAPCTVDEMRDTLNRVLGPIAYAQILGPDTITLYSDGSVQAGQSYLYAFVPETRGATWSVVDSVGGRLVSRELLFEQPVHELPRSTSASNVVTVYVPASGQAGGARANIAFREEKAGATIDTILVPRLPPQISSWNAFFLDIMGPITEELQLRLLLGEQVRLEEFRRGAASTLPDSVRVKLVRTRTTGFTITGSGLTARATPVRQVRDTVVLRAGPEGVPFRSRVAVTPTISTVGGVSVTTTLIVGPAGVLVREDKNTPLFISNFLGTSLYSFTPQTYPGHASYIPLRVHVDTTSLTSAVNKGWLSTARFSPTGERVAPNQIFQPLSLEWLQAASRPTGAGPGGDYAVKIAAEEFGSSQTFRIDQGAEAIAARLSQSLAARAVAARGARDDAAAKVVAKYLNRPKITADSLLDLKLPFSITNRSFGSAEVRIAMLKADKDTTYLLGVGADTLRIVLPAAVGDQWLPGDRLILIEDVPVGATSEAVVSFYPAVLGCTTSGVTPRCNPVSGPGGDPNYGATAAGFEIRARYLVPARAPREVAFTVLPTLAGGKIAAISQAQMDSINVVPNPYVVFSTFEQQGNSQRILFSHLPPAGKIQIFTVAGQFVQELNWTEAELKGSGDLFFNMRTREGTEMASGLYLYVVTASDPASGRTLKKLGRFIIIR